MKRKLRKTCLGLVIMMMVSVFGNATPAFAAESPSTRTVVRNVNGATVTINGVEDGDDIDGLLEEVSLKSDGSTDPITIMPMNADIGTGQHYIGNVTFYDTNWGNYFHVNAGSKMYYVVYYQKADTNTYSADLYVDCYQYGGRCMQSMYCSFGNNPHVSLDGFARFTSNTFSISSGTDYHFYYKAFTSGSNNEPRRVTAKVWVVIS